MGDVDTDCFDEPGFVARHGVQRAIDMNDEQAGINELRRLIAEGLDVSALGCDGDGLSVFFWAAKRGRTSLAAALIDAGATLEPEVAARGVPPGHEDSALHAAVEQGNIEMVKLFLGAGGKPLLARFDHVDKTPLHIAAQRGDLPMVKLLISAGAKVNAHNEAHIGYAPLDGAVESGSVEVVRWLLGAGANPLEETWMRITPVHRAVHRGAKGEAVLEEFRKKLKMPEKQWKLLTQRKKKSSPPPPRHTEPIPRTTVPASIFRRAKKTPARRGGDSCPCLYTSPSAGVWAAPPRGAYAGITGSLNHCPPGRTNPPWKFCTCMSW